MGKFFAFEITGLKEVISGLEEFGEDIEARLDQELAASANTIAREAKQRVPKKTGALAAAITPDHDGKLKHGVSVRKHYSPYVEFGTGGLVDVPVGLEDYAIQFKGRDIIQVNMPASPYLFPAYEEEKKRLLDFIKKDLVRSVRSGISILRQGGSNITGTTTI